jgi:PiT family inorganic phosphate transporter
MSGNILGLPAGRVVDLLHGVSGFSMGFARGLNDTPKILALLVAAEFSGLDTRASLGLVAILMACGGVLQGKRVARTLGRRITELNRGQGLLSNLIGSSLVIAASVLGMPVSTTHVSTGAVFGMGIWTGRTSGRMIARIVLAWVVTLPLAAALAWAIATAVD